MIGSPIERIDGPFKVSGTARYALDRRETEPPLSGVIVGAAIGLGRIRRIDPAEAEAAPGVALVLTHLNAPPQGRLDTSTPAQFSRARPVFTDDRIRHAGQAVALVVADTLQRAQAAAALLVVEYEPEEGEFVLKDQEGYAPETANAGFATDTAVGDFEHDFAGAPVRLDRAYRTSHQAAHALEPDACQARWQGDQLHLWSSLQSIRNARAAVAATLCVPEEAVHLDAAFVGGGFGSKLNMHAETICAALAARILDRPVRVSLARRQMTSLVGGRPETRQRVRLAATPGGRLTGIAHEVWMQGSRDEEFVEQTATVTRSLYAGAHRLTRHRVVPLDRPLAEAVRAPGELPGLLAVETAMDELAYELGIDPVQLRLLNDVAIDPERGLPLSSRRLADCLRSGAELFGWARRPQAPGAAREGRLLVGWGMASAIRSHFQSDARAIVRVAGDGHIQVLSDMTDIGTGTYTIVAQMAAATLGVPLEAVEVQLARTDLPAGGGSGGSWGAANTCLAVRRACEALKDKARAGGVLAPGLEAEGSIVGQADDPRYERFSQHAYGAHFAEVAVDMDTFEVRVRRMLGVFAAGRILNARTARSQLQGGMMWGIGSALSEAGHIDPRFGHMVNGDLGEYLVPTHADVPPIEVHLLDDVDEGANEMGIKGVGELGACGSGAAVTNAIYHATGIRVREFPITPARLLLAAESPGRC